MSNEGKTFKDLINSILTPEQKATVKKFMGENPAFTPAPVAEVKLGTGKLKDGTMVEYDTEVLGVGSMVMVVTADGQKLPAPQGEHTLEDGTVIVVDETGKVMEVKPATPAAEPVIEEQKATNPLIDALKALMEGKFEAQSKEISSSKEEVEYLKKIVEAQKNELETFKAFFNSLIDTPTAEPVAVTQEFKTSKKLKNLSKFIN